jgi:uncharacterized protein
MRSVARGLLVMLCVLSVHIVYGANQPAVVDVCIKGSCVHSEVADSDYSRQRGLMYRESLAKDEGMLFSYGKDGVYAFWMMNTFIPLDMLWISAEKKIVHIAENVQPCAETCESIVPPVQARYVLEVNAGFTSNNNIVLGDAVSF